MKKISICMQNNMLLFKYRIKKVDDVNLLNTNVISNNELIFSDEYIVQNKKIVSLFLKDLVNTNGISTVVFSNNAMALLFTDLIADISNIKILYLQDNETLTYALCEKISVLKHIEVLNCYAIPQFMIELLDKNNIKVESRNEVLFTSTFMLDNDLTSFSKLYYKTSIKLGDVLSSEDLEDFYSFCKINKYLKVIHLDTYRHDDLIHLCTILSHARKKNITIQVHEDINDPDIIEELRIINKNLKKEKKIKLMLVYSKDYLERNYLKQVIYTTLKICSCIIFLVVCSVFGYIFYTNYTSELEVDKIITEVKDIMEQDIEEEPSFVENPNKTRPIINSYDKLLSVNSDTVGWLTVLGTKIDYPVVQTTDNIYYLNRNYYKERDYNGWVFMDYRNNPEEVSDNTIIYAHNRYYSGIMFGTLNKVTRSSWYNKEENLYITFNTLYDSLKWKVFSIYSIDVTSDYLYTSFVDRQEYQMFLDKIKARSDIPFDTPVTNIDNILTLSTCLDDNKRLVLHAVLVKEEKMS